MTRPLVRTTMARLAELAHSDGTAGADPPTGPCRCCGVKAPVEAELTLSAVGLCWSCQDYHEEWAATVATLPALPLPRCAERQHSRWGADGNPLMVTEPWRRDPRARLWDFDHDDHSVEPLQVWLRRHGATDATVYETNFHLVVLGDFPDGAWVVSYDPYRDWEYHGAAGQAVPISEPARHEVLAMLRRAESIDPFEHLRA